VAEGRERVLAINAVKRTTSIDLAYHRPLPLLTMDGNACSTQLDECVSVSFIFIFTTVLTAEDRFSNYNKSSLMLTNCVRFI